MSDPIAYSEPKAGTLVRNALWANLRLGDVGQPFGYPDHADRSIQVSGPFGVGGVLIVEGRNFGQSGFDVLRDFQGNELLITAAGLYQITEITDEIRVRVSAGDANTLLAAALMARRSP